MICVRILTHLSHGCSDHTSTHTSAKRLSSSHLLCESFVRNSKACLLSICMSRARKCFCACSSCDFNRSCHCTEGNVVTVQQIKQLAQVTGVDEDSVAKLIFQIRTNAVEVRCVISLSSYLVSYSADRASFPRFKSTCGLLWSHVYRWTSCYDYCSSFLAERI